MLIYEDLYIVLELQNKLNWQHDEEILLIYEHVQLVVIQVGNELKLDIYGKKKKFFHEYFKRIF